MCLEAGNILLIKNFQFEDADATRDKYLIVVTTDQDKTIFVRCLTTSVQKIPDDRVIHGCCNSVCGTFSHYVFEKSRAICDNRFSFPKHTFVYYNNNVREISIDLFEKKTYDISLVGRLTPTEYKRFIKCMKGSRHIQRAIKPIIDAINIS